MRTIDLNCDLGESTSLWPYHISHDLSLLPYITSANIACGYHAGDPDTAKALIDEAIARNIAIGAHVSFPDRENFGRNEVYFKEKELYQIIYDQVQFIASLAVSRGRRMRHVKPHGALYNMAAKDHRLAFIVCSAIQSYDEDLAIFGLAGSEIVRVADSIGLQSCNEVFVDRTYQDDGSLTARTEESALIRDEEECKRRVLQIIMKGTVTSTSGNNIPVKAESICIHSDNKYSLQFAKLINETLRHHGVQVVHY